MFVWRYVASVSQAFVNYFAIVPICLVNLSNVTQLPRSWISRTLSSERKKGKLTAVCSRSPKNYHLFILVPRAPRFFFYFKALTKRNEGSGDENAFDVKRNVPKCKAHVQRHCFRSIIKPVVPLSLPLLSWFLKLLVVSSNPQHERWNCPSYKW